MVEQRILLVGKYDIENYATYFQYSQNLGSKMKVKN